jgi:hypothetical protein
MTSVACLLGRFSGPRRVNSRFLHVGSPRQPPQHVKKPITTNHSDTRTIIAIECRASSRIARFRAQVVLVRAVPLNILRETANGRVGIWTREQTVGRCAICKSWFSSHKQVSSGLPSLTKCIFETDSVRDNCFLTCPRDCIILVNHRWNEDSFGASFRRKA